MPSTSRRTASRCAQTCNNVSTTVASSSTLTARVSLAPAAPTTTTQDRLSRTSSTTGSCTCPTCSTGAEQRSTRASPSNFCTLASPTPSSAFHAWTTTTFTLIPFRSRRGSRCCVRTSGGGSWGRQKGSWPPSCRHLIVTPITSLALAVSAGSMPFGTWVPPSLARRTVLQYSF